MQDESKNKMLDKTATGLVGKLVSVGIDGMGPLDSAASIAEKALAKTGNVEAAVTHVINSHSKAATASGFVTGVGGFVVMPVSLPLNVVGFYGVATRMVAAIAHLRGYDLTRDEVRSAVMLTLVGADSRSILEKAGLGATGRLAGMATQHLPGPAVMVVNKAIGFRLLSQMGTKGFTRFGRAVPLVGGVLGAGLDLWMLRKIAGSARDEFVQRVPNAVR